MDADCSSSSGRTVGEAKADHRQMTRMIECGSARAAAQSGECDYVFVYLRRCGHRIPESQDHSTFVILPDSTSIWNGPHGLGKRFSASDTA